MRQAAIADDEQCEQQGNERGGAVVDAGKPHGDLVTDELDQPEPVRVLAAQFQPGVRSETPGPETKNKRCVDTRVQVGSFESHCRCFFFVVV